MEATMNATAAAYAAAAAALPTATDNEDDAGEEEGGWNVWGGKVKMPLLRYLIHKWAVWLKSALAGAWLFLKAYV